MLKITGPDVVLWIHVLAACIWIGGQVTLALMAPLLSEDPDAMRSIARRFQGFAWGAFAILIVTGLINVHDAGISLTHLNANAQSRTLSIKLGFVVVSGAAAALHGYWVTPRMREATPGRRIMASVTLGSVSVLGAMLAALFGVVIAQS